MRRWTLILLCLALASCKRSGAPEQAPRGPGISLALPDGGVDFAEGAVTVPEVQLPSLAPLVERISPRW